MWESIDDPAKQYNLGDLIYTLLRFRVSSCEFVDHSFWPREEDDPRNHTNQHEQNTEGKSSFDPLSYARAYLMPRLRRLCTLTIKARALE
jgi:hypothetical protein